MGRNAYNRGVKIEPMPIQLIIAGVGMGRHVDMVRIKSSFNPRIIACGVVYAP
jgi:hypothetical protein